jgi:hypothetical protein
MKKQKNKISKNVDINKNLKQKKEENIYDS